MDYDVIGKIESHTADTARIFLESGLMDKIPNVEVSTNMNPHHSGEKDNKTWHYMSMLSPKQRRLLYESYRVDFEMFGYSAEEFL